ncbi:alpha/beta fold hydrolase [Pseudonocardia cypriaca]|uniref:Pimeloyl-ACP methyl ester carboxylesterase n=1 Tax=Pseudonocardia cypriaca TaxID=882449 RepID=A0A543FW22_9PSEU|nr:alpha/beta fold hydrolase [Pseudonocardia cypriaca]TQM38035.1 pimeloyl-ACP methyl ester carboxylesterase [Pseudonocardia cypriaca]
MTDIYNSPEGARTVAERYRELLDAWPVPAEHLHVPTREGDTFVVASGPPDGPPLVLLHGSGSNALMWVPDVASWSEHFRVYAVDIIGEPGLSAPARPPLPSGAYPLWFGDVLDALGVARASVVAVSLGGWLALDFATRHPERVERLTLLTPTGVAKAKVAGLLGAVLLKPFGGWGKRKSMEVLLGPEVRKQQGSVEFVELLARHYRYRREPVPVIDDAALRGATMPILAVLGGRDAFIDTPRTAERLSRLVPSATVRVLPGIGHLLPAQTAPILEFLRAGR